MKNFYVTTPIYYVNDEPHIGHAYTTILADVLTRYHRLFGDKSFFLTGLDEHGQKVQEASAKRGVAPQDHCDQMAGRFTELWKKLEISNNDFIRTTQARHRTIVQKVLQELFDQGQIYSAEYDGWYCTPDERFWTEKDLQKGNCPDCGRPVVRITEKNYFFKMSEHQAWLIDEINSGRMVIKPESRKNEVLGFLKQPLNDLCISRPKKRLSWGIELPFDSEYVTYVWFDALINYISAMGYNTSEDSLYREFWPSVLHLLGKDILTTHSIYWPTMLHAMKVKTPQTILAHGWWLIDDSKMSKSRGTVVKPLEMADKYGVEQFRYFLMKEMTLGADANFSEEALIARVNSDLANDYGNLVSRVFKMLESYCGGIVPQPKESEDGIREVSVGLGQKVRALIDDLEPNKALEEILEQVRATNRYVESNAPWKLHKEGNQERINTVLYNAADALRIASILLYPVMPGKCMALLAKLGVEEKDITLALASEWGLLKQGQKISAGEPLFPRIEKNIGISKTKDGIQKKDKKVEESNKAESTTAVVEDLIDIDHFKKVKLRTAEIISAEKVPNADKLLRLQVKLGEETRQVLAGIAQWYAPESLVGQQVIIVANLKPAKIRGLESHGMLLAAQDQDGVVILTPQRKTATGSEVR